MSWNNGDSQGPGQPPQNQPPQNPWGQPQQPPAYQPPPEQPQQPVAQPGYAQPYPYGQEQTGQEQTGQQPTTPYAAPAPTGHYASVPPGGSPPPEKRRMRKGAVIGIISGVVVLVLLVVGGIVGVNIGNAAHAPENDVTEYLEALKTGDAEAALELSGAKTDEGDVLLSNEVYAETEDRISRYAIEDSTISGDTATVTARITQGGEDYTQEFTLQRAGKEFVIFDLWQLESPEFATISVSVDAPEGTATTVGGVDVTEREPGESGAWELRALPGTYAISVAESEWFSAEPQTASVIGFGPDASPEAAELSIALTEAGTQAAEEAVNAYLDQCVAAAQLQPEGCPFQATGGTPGYEYTNVVWTVDPRPDFTIGEYRDGTWPVSTDSEGSASMTCDLRDPASGATGTATAGPMPVSVRGQITAFGEDGATYEP
ncbi:hypothetical protein GCM10027416_26600 [Okibacterium endophyticum]